LDVVVAALAPDDLYKSSWGSESSMRARRADVRLVAMSVEDFAALRAAADPEREERSPRACSDADGPEAVALATSRAVRIDTISRVVIKMSWNVIYVSADCAAARRGDDGAFRVGQPLELSISPAADAGADPSILRVVPQDDTGTWVSGIWSITAWRYVAVRSAAPILPDEVSSSRAASIALHMPRKFVGCAPELARIERTSVTLTFVCKHEVRGPDGTNADATTTATDVFIDDTPPRESCTYTLATKLPGGRTTDTLVSDEYGDRSVSSPVAWLTYEKRYVRGAAPEAVALNSNASV
jgi:hypothetical protein